MIMENIGMRLNEFKLWTALVTPLLEDGTVNVKDLQKLLKIQENAKNGIVILGSTGESLNLSLEEKKLVVETTVEMKLSVPVMVGVSGHDLSSVLDWLRFLEGVAIDAYLMVTPIYSKPGAEGQYYWFKTLLDNVSRPSMLYNVPGRTACVLNTEAVTRLSNHPNFWAIKESGGTVDSFIKYTKSVNNGHVFCGDDPLLPDFVPFDAAGLISVASNVWPNETHAYVELALRNELNQRDLFIWKTAGNALFVASNPIPVKALMAIEGQITSGTVKLPLHQDDLKTPEILIEATIMIRNWYSNYRYSERLKESKKNNMEIA
jgi:4-hydroxy-tetrahydrodipicolinate synthase